MLERPLNSPRFPSRSDIELCTLEDKQVFRRRLRGMEHRKRQGQPIDQGLERLWQAVRESQALLERRRLRIPSIVYPPGLPVSERRDEVARLIEAHQSVADIESLNELLPHLLDLARNVTNAEAASFML